MRKKPQLRSASYRSKPLKKVVNPHNAKRKRVRRPPKKTTRALNAKKANTQLSPQKANVVEMKQAIWEMKIGGYAQIDMARSLDISEGRVSQLVKEVLAERTAQLHDTVEEALAIEHARINQMIVAWHLKARVDPRSADVYLAWTERKHKILGLDVNKTELFGRNGGPIQLQASSIDISKLNDEELGWLEKILMKAGPDAARIEQMPASDKIVETASQAITPA
jgi:hypothetical protein